MEHFLISHQSPFHFPISYQAKCKTNIATFEIRSLDTIKLFINVPICFSILHIEKNKNLNIQYYNFKFLPAFLLHIEIYFVVCLTDVIRKIFNLFSKLHFMAACWKLHTDYFYLINWFKEKMSHVCTNALILLGMRYAVWW